MYEMSEIVLMLIILTGFFGISLGVVSSMHYKITQRSLYADKSTQVSDARFSFLKNERKVERVLLFLKYGLLTFTLLCTTSLTFIYASGIY